MSTIEKLIDTLNIDNNKIIVNNTTPTYIMCINASKSPIYMLMYLICNVERAYLPSQNNSQHHADLLKLDETILLPYVYLVIQICNKSLSY